MSIWIQLSNESVNLEKEERLIHQYVVSKGMDVVFFDKYTLINTDSYDISNCDLLVGDVDTYIAGIKKLGKSVPRSNYYPKSLASYLYRDVWSGSKYSVLAEMAQGKEVFAKPLDWKLFTGQVFEQSSGFSHLFNN